MSARLAIAFLIGIPVLFVAYWAYQIALAVVSGWCLLKRRVGGWI